MSKELEALENLGRRAYLKESEHRMLSSRCINTWECLPEYQIIKQALTPPTADEVCKALSEHEKRNVFYSDVTQEFYYLEYEGKNGEYQQFITETYGDGLWSLGVYLPPHLITLIGRFYEGLEK